MGFLPVQCHIWVPRRAEDVHRLGEDVVVEDAGMDGEGPHQEDDVATTKEHVPNL